MNALLLSLMLRTASVVFCILVLLLAAPPVRADQETDDDEPIPSSVDQMTGPMERFGREKPLRIPRFFPWLKEQLKDTPAFFRDTRMDASLRSYFSRISRYDDSISQAWAMGAAVDYRSGLFLDRVGIGATLYSSQPVSAPEGYGGSGVLQADQSGITVLGQLYGQIKIADRTFAHLYHYNDYKSPFLSKDDGKMIPYSFEGYTLQGVLGGEEGEPRFTYGGGYIVKLRDKTQCNYLWMSEKAGSTAKRGVGLLGGLYSFKEWSLGAIDYYSDDIINIGYTEGTYTLDLDNGVGLRLAVQYVDQRSVGEELLTCAPFSANLKGVKGDVSYQGAVMTLAFTSITDSYDIQKPWSGNPGYSGAMITNYLKAGTNAWYLKCSYDFSRIGLDGLAAYALVTHGWGAVDKGTKAPLPGENELNADLQWRPSWEWLKGLWVRLRYGVVHQYEGDKKYSHDGRVIVRYDYPLM